MKTQVNVSSLVGYISYDIVISVASVKRLEVWHYADARRHASVWSITGAFHRLLQLLDPITKSTCLKSMPNFVEVAPNMQYYFKPHQMHDITGLSFSSKPFMPHIFYEQVYNIGTIIRLFCEWILDSPVVSDGISGCHDE